MFKRYLAGELCGHLITHCWVNGHLLPSSKAMKVGSFFEFCLSGALPKDGQIPVPDMMADGKKMKEPYRKASNDAKYVKKLLSDMGLKIIQISHKLTRGRFEGTVDLVCVAERDIVSADGFVIKAGQWVIVDLKYSGLIDDNWNDMGWVFKDKQKEYHKIQAIQYHYISKNLPFLFLVTDSSHKEKDDDEVPILPNVELFHTPVTEAMVEAHIIEANELEEKFEF